MHNAFLTRVFSVGSAALQVRCPSDRVRACVEALFADLAPGDPATVTVATLTDADGGQLALSIRDQEFPARPPDAALAALVTATSRLALDNDPSRLHLHGAGLARNGRGVVISATSGTGKTTLAAALAADGWAYVSDEALAFGLQSTSLSGFAKPLMIKPGGGHVLPHLRGARVGFDDDVDTWWHIPASAIPTEIASELEPTLVVLLQRVMGPFDESKVAPLHAADAVVALMGETMDPERFGPSAVIALAELASRARCVTMTVGALDSEVAHVNRLIDQPPFATPLRVLDPGAAGPAAGWSVPPTVLTVVLDERAVVHDTAGGSIVALDDAGSALWRAFYGDQPMWWTAEVYDQPGTAMFLGQLGSLGLLQPAGGPR